MKLKDHYETMPLRGKVVAVPVGEETAFSGALKTNRTGAAILELLREETTEEEIVEKLSKRFDVPKERLREDVRQYLSALREKNLII